MLARMTRTFRYNINRKLERIVEKRPARIRTFLIACRQFNVAVQVKLTRRRIVRVRNIITIHVHGRLTKELRQRRVNSSGVRTDLFLSLAHRHINEFLTELVGTVRRNPLTNVKAPTGRRAALLIFGVTKSTRRPRRVIASFLTWLRGRFEH